MIRRLFNFLRRLMASSARGIHAAERIDTTTTTSLLDTLANLSYTGPMKNTGGMSLDYSLKLEIPFMETKQAQTAVQVLLPDPILKKEDFQVHYTNDENILVAEFQSIDDRVLRVGVSSVIDSIKTIIETMDELI